MVLDVLSLIDNLIQKLLILIRNDISFQQIIRSNQHIIGRIFIQLLPALLLASCNQQHLQLRCETFKLFSPVEYERSGAHNQGGACPAFFFCRQKHGDRLKSLPKPHIICQETSESACLQCTQPSIALFLISAHNP